MPSLERERTAAFISPRTEDGGLSYARFATQEGYPGAHYMAYDPKTGRVQDFGIGPRYEGINTGAYDPKFNRIYGLTHPRGHFVYYDVATGAKVDMGRMNNWDSICRTLGIDDEGNVYGSFGAGRIYKYDPRTDNVRELSVQVPITAEGNIAGARLQQVGNGVAHGRVGPADEKVLWGGRERDHSLLLRSLRRARTVRLSGWDRCASPSSPTAATCPMRRSA